MKVTLLTYTPNPEAVVAASAKLCYSPKSATEIWEKIKDNEEENALFIQKLVDMGHESPLEHVTFTFAIEGVSRVLSHQLVRHRIASYSQRSQRYVNEGGFDFVVPPSLKGKYHAVVMFTNLMKKITKTYTKLIEEGVLEEDARYVLPNAAKTNLACTFNARSLINMFGLRCCTRAQWEIRSMANQMLQQVREVAPHLFCNAGARCERLGYCPEGKMTCGRYPTLEEIKKTRTKTVESKQEQHQDTPHLEHWQEIGHEYGY